MIRIHKPVLLHFIRPEKNPLLSMQKSPDHKEYKNGRYTNDPALLYETSKVAQARPSGAIPVKPENTGQATQNSAIHFLPTEFFVFHISKLHNNFKQKRIKRGLPPSLCVSLFSQNSSQEKDSPASDPSSPALLPEGEGRKEPLTPGPSPGGRGEKNGISPLQGTRILFSALSVTFPVSSYTRTRYT